MPAGHSRVTKHGAPHVSESESIPLAPHRTVGQHVFPVASHPAYQTHVREQEEIRSLWRYVLKDQRFLETMRRAIGTIAVAIARSVDGTGASMQEDGPRLEVEDASDEGGMQRLVAETEQVIEDELRELEALCLRLYKEREGGPVSALGLRKTHWEALEPLATSGEPARALRRHRLTMRLREGRRQTGLRHRTSAVALSGDTEQEGCITASLIHDPPTGRHPLELRLAQAPKAKRKSPPRRTVGLAAEHKPVNLPDSSHAELPPLLATGRNSSQRTQEIFRTIPRDVYCQELATASAALPRLLPAADTGLPNCSRGSDAVVLQHIGRGPGRLEPLSMAHAQPVPRAPQLAPHIINTMDFLSLQMEPPTESSGATAGEATARLLRNDGGESSAAITSGELRRDLRVCLYTLLNTKAVMDFYDFDGAPPQTKATPSGTTRLLRSGPRPSSPTAVARAVAKQMAEILLGDSDGAAPRPQPPSAPLALPTELATATSLAYTANVARLNAGSALMQTRSIPPLNFATAGADAFGAMDVTVDGNSWCVRQRRKVPLSLAHQAIVQFSVQPTTVVDSAVSARAKQLLVKLGAAHPGRGPDPRALPLPSVSPGGNAALSHSLNPPPLQPQLKSRSCVRFDDVPDRQIPCNSATERIRRKNDTQRKQLTSLKAMVMETHAGRWTTSSDTCLRTYQVIQGAR